MLSPADKLLLCMKNLYEAIKAKHGSTNRSAICPRWRKSFEHFLNDVMSFTTPINAIANFLQKNRFDFAIYQVVLDYANGKYLEPSDIEFFNRVIKSEHPAKLILERMLADKNVTEEQINFFVASKGADVWNEILHYKPGRSK